MVSQILYGETYEVLEEADSWQFIRMEFDGYEGWADGLPGLESENHEQYIVHSPFIEEDGHFLPMGAVTDIFQPKAPGILQTANSLLNVPYLWGGRTFMGIDCSAFIQVVFKANGIALPRDAYQQAKVGDSVPLEQAKEGDLAFFVSKAGKIDHVGIILTNGMIIHASKYVRIDQLTVDGIITHHGKQTHKLHEVRRV